MRLPGGICVSGPPCSLWVWISRGTHKRRSSRFNLYGNVKLKSVRMSNAIARNFVARRWSQFCLDDFDVIWLQYYMYSYVFIKYHQSPSNFINFGNSRSDMIQRLATVQLWWPESIHGFVAGVIGFKGSVMVSLCKFSLLAILADAFVLWLRPT